MITVDIVAKIVAIVGGLIAAFKLLTEMKENRKQRLRELRWKQANSAREMLKEMLSDKLAYDATIMIDWTKRSFQIEPDKKEPISFEDIRHGLRTVNTQFTQKEIYIRDCIDAFLFHTELMEQAIENNLVQAQDLKFPMEYYVHTLAKNKLLAELNTYLDGYDYKNSRNLLVRFSRH